MSGTPAPAEHAGRLAGLSDSQIFSSGPVLAIALGAAMAAGVDEPGSTCEPPVTGVTVAMTGAEATGVTFGLVSTGAVNGAMAPKGFSYCTSLDETLTPPMSMMRKPVPDTMSRPMSATRPAPAAWQKVP